MQPDEFWVLDSRITILEIGTRIGDLIRSVFIEPGLAQIAPRSITDVKRLYNSGGEGISVKVGNPTGNKPCVRNWVCHIYFTF